MDSEDEPVDFVYISTDESVPELIETVRGSFAHPSEGIERFGRHYTLVHKEPAGEGRRPRLFYRDAAA